MTAIILIIKNIAGWLSLHWRTTAICGAVAVVLIAVLVLSRSCGKKTPKLDQQAVQKIQDAIASGDRQTRIEVLAESKGKEAATDQDVANAKVIQVQTTQQAKKDASQLSNDELAAELDRMAKENQ